MFPSSFATAWDDPAFLYPTALTMLYDVALHIIYKTIGAVTVSKIMYSFSVRTAYEMYVYWHPAYVRAFSSLAAVAYCIVMEQTRMPCHVSHPTRWTEELVFFVEPVCIQN